MNMHEPTPPHDNMEKPKVEQKQPEGKCTITFDTHFKLWLHPKLYMIVGQRDPKGAVPQPKVMILTTRCTAGCF